MDMNKLTGMIAPMVVPFDASGELDEAAFRAEARFLLDHGVDGISSGGSTGEGALLSDAELRRCLEIIGEENRAKIPVYAGIIRNSTRDVIRAGLDAKACGADVLLVTPVFYHGATPEGNFEFYRAICETVKLPVIIYNVVVSNLITPEQFKNIARIDGVIGIKQVDPVRLAEICVVNDGTYNVYAAGCRYFDSSLSATRCRAAGEGAAVAGDALDLRYYRCYNRVIS